MNIWFNFLYQPLLNLLVFFYQALGQNLGIAIIALTTLVNVAFIPLTKSSMDSAKKMQEIKPELDKLKKKHKDDKQELAKAQMELYKKHGINPAGGFLPMILRIVVIFALFQVFNNVLKADFSLGEISKDLYSFLSLPENFQFNLQFLYLNIGQPDVIKLPFEINLGIVNLKTFPGPILILAAVGQLASSKLMQINNGGKKKEEKQKKEGQEDMQDMAMNMQKQMVFLFPLMTLFIGMRFPAGIVLYWVALSIVLTLQQYLSKKAGATAKTK